MSNIGIGEMGFNGEVKHDGFKEGNKAVYAKESGILQIFNPGEDEPAIELSRDAAIMVGDFIGRMLCEQRLYERQVNPHD